MTLRKVVASLFGTSPSVSSQEEPSKIAIPQTYLLQAYKSEQHNGFFRRFQVASSFTNPFAAALFGVGVFSLEKALESSQLSKEALRRLAPLFGLKFFDGACLKPTTFSTEQGKFVVWSPPDTDAQMRYDQMGNPWPGRTLSVNEREKLLNHLQLIDPKAKMDADGITIYEHLDAFSDDHWVDTFARGHKILWSDFRVMPLPMTRKKWDGKEPLCFEGSFVFAHIPGPREGEGVKWVYHSGGNDSPAFIERESRALVATWGMLPVHVEHYAPEPVE